MWGTTLSEERQQLDRYDARMQPAPLPQSFYQRDAREVARDLIGCYLVRTPSAERLQSGRDEVVAARIVETEAYLPDDPASHSYGGRTRRTAAMFGPAGVAYVYFIYGNHYCLNAVTGPEGHGAAVLLRSAVPVAGLRRMVQRRFIGERSTVCEGAAREVGDAASPAGTKHATAGTGRRTGGSRRLRDLCNGPGKLAQAFAITSADNGRPLTGSGGDALRGRNALILTGMLPPQLMTCWRERLEADLCGSGSGGRGSGTGGAAVAAAGFHGLELQELSRGRVGALLELLAGAMREDLSGSIVADRRIGISRSTDRLWRFLVAGSAFVSFGPSNDARSIRALPRLSGLAHPF